MKHKVGRKYCYLKLLIVFYRNKCASKRVIEIEAKLQIFNIKLDDYLRGKPGD